MKRLLCGGDSGDFERAAKKKSAAWQDCHSRRPDLEPAYFLVAVAVSGG
jgi:hypothetical protein